MGRELRAVSLGRARAALFGLGMLAASGCATAGGASRIEASPGEPVAAPVSAGTPTSAAPAARPTSAAPAASPPRATHVTAVGAWPADTPSPPPPAAPPGVAANDPRIDEALGRLDPKMPSGCRTYANAYCRTETVPDYGRLEVCAGVVENINKMVKQLRQTTSAVDSCNMMAKSAPPK